MLLKIISSVHSGSPGWACQSTSWKAIASRVEKAQSNKWGHSFEEMLKLIHYLTKYLRHYNTWWTTQILGGQSKYWDEYKTTWGFQRPGETPICSDAASTKYSQNTQFSFVPIILWSNSLEAWHLHSFSGIWALRNGPSVSPQPQAGGSGSPLCQPGTAETPRPTKPIYFLQQQKAGWKIQLRLFSSWFNLTLC